MTPPQMDDVAVQLERLRGVVSTGFAELRGDLKAALQRTDIAEADITDLQRRVRTLEMKVWTASGAAAGLGGLGGWLLQQIGG